MGREAEIKELLALLGESDENAGDNTMRIAYPMIVVYGYNSTGKSMCSRLVLKKLNAVEPFCAFVDCTTVYTKRQIFTDILRQVGNGINVCMHIS